MQSTNSQMLPKARQTFVCRLAKVCFYKSFHCFDAFSVLTWSVGGSLQICGWVFGCTRPVGASRRLFGTVQLFFWSRLLPVLPPLSVHLTLLWNTIIWGGWELHQCLINCLNVWPSSRYLQLIYNLWAAPFCHRHEVTAWTFWRPDFDLVFASTPVQADSLSTPSLEISTED